MSKYKRIILHVGLSKTGSTSMQDNCTLHRQFLAERGVLYPQFEFEGVRFPNHSIVLTGAVTQEPGSYGLRLRQRFPGREVDVLDACVNQLSDVLARGDGQTLVLSTELIEGFSANHAKVLRQQLTGATQELCVLAVVRSPISALTSLMQERVKAGAIVSPQMLAGRVKDKCDRIRQHFGEAVQFANYHELSKHPMGLVGAWFELLGIDRDQLLQLEFVNRNPSLCHEAYLLMRAVNDVYPVASKAVHNVPRSQYDLDFLMQMPGQRFVIPRLNESTAYQVCLTESVWLQDELGLVFPEESHSAVPGELWQADTIAAMGNLAHKITHPAVRSVIAVELNLKAQQLLSARPLDAARLQDIAQALQLPD